MKRSLKYTKQPNRIDFGFLAILIGMMITSLIAIFTSFNLMSQSLSGTSVMIQQLVWYAFSFFIMGLIMFFGNDTVMKYIKLIYYYPNIWKLFWEMAVICRWLMTSTAHMPGSSFPLPAFSPVNS